MALTLEALGGCEQRVIDRGRADDMRMCRIDLRTASRKARMAFSIALTRAELKADCKKMADDGILHDAETFDDLMKRCEALQKRAKCPAIAAPSGHKIVGL
ncbi:hypothetical protein XI03_05045 [Bradyrhizobium sp. CCBAU 65884]|uniref:hypothetical protein n=1 Tax=Bradyrhizobium sp. CCBAU 65884 TaxID=722477 RepID=UPI0023066BD5|nr:hypothetical protein [Bradyrhizobium sp. CCBAU 65884]MDA9473887.1 hypothetical protein [Bradyrhizobium sp. CCBAU 65884]